MNAQPATHPSAEQLSAFALGKLDEAAVAAIHRHLETCESCRRTASSIPGDTFLNKVRSARGPVSVTSATPSPPASLASASIAPAPPRALPALPPELASHAKFLIVRELGRGGMGVVYQAEHRLMKRPVAIKVLNPRLLDNPTSLARFHQEVEAAAQLTHPNIVTAHDAEQAGTLHLLVMEYVEGQSLAQVLDRKGPLPVIHACKFIWQAAKGLQHAFTKKMVHRDIKPQNLMLTPQGVVKILDFGLARLAERPPKGSLTLESITMGTPEYMAPEQAHDARQADIRSDIYSLGCTLYCLLTGHPPFQGETPLQVIFGHLEKEVPPLRPLRPEVPESLSAVVGQMLAKKPEERYQTPAQVMTALAPFCKPGGPAAVEPGSPWTDLDVKAEQPTRPKHRPAAPRRRWAAAAAVMGALLAGLGLTEAAGVTNVRGTVIRLFSPDGTLVVEVDDPGVSVTIDGEEMVIIGAGAKEIRLKPGQYRVLASKDGKVLRQELVTVTKNGRQVVRVSREPTDREEPAPTASGTSMAKLSLPITRPPPHVDPLAEIPPLEKMDADFPQVWDIIRMKARNAKAGWDGFRVGRNDERSQLFAAPAFQFSHEYVILEEGTSLTWTLPPKTRSFTAIALHLGSGLVRYTVSFDGQPHFGTGLTRLYRIGLEVPEGCRTISLSVHRGSPNVFVIHRAPAFWLVPRLRSRPLSEVRDFLEEEGATKLTMLKPERGEPKVVRNGSQSPKPEELVHTPPYYTQLPICRNYLSVHANSTATYDIPPGAKRFRAVAYAYLSRSVRFLVQIDGKEVFRSPVLGIMPVDVPLPEGASEITVRTDTCGDGNSDWAYWCYPRFVGGLTVTPDRRANPAGME